MLNETAALTVSELNEYARRLLAGDPLLRSVEVTGEISGYKHHYSGHRYFSLKDESARVQCVMFRQNAMGLDFKPEDGMRVNVRGSASVFVRDGSYQLYVSAMRQAGQGDLFQRFEALKKKLQAEGLFDPARKREIPMLPRVIGVATSETGAAIRDIIQVARRRDPNVGIVVAPCAVQGAGAAGEIVRSIRWLNERGGCDVLLVGRGGGSMEDLWAFNEEPVARAIAASRTPVISCVGHEIDFTIADFVADLRAPTPSAAAELAVPVLDDLRATLDSALARLAQALTTGQSMRRLRLSKLCAASVLQRPIETIVEARRPMLALMDARLRRTLPTIRDKARARLDHAAASLRALDPEAVLERGYAIVSDGRGLIDRTAKVGPGDIVNIRMADGTLDAEVTSIHPKGDVS
ncbi:MAG: exodeoxyribonuclease VII large subunit [Clostridia bacterium]|nr:exodeoxyribonuclease VII large subunit [Clostridia bacterium]